MSSEISLTSKLQVTKNAVTVVNAVSTKSQTMAAALEKLHHTVQAITTAREAVSLGDVDNSYAAGDEHFVVLYNRGETYNVKVEVKTGASTYQQVGLMRPGEPWGPVRMQKLDVSGYGGLYLTSVTGDADVEVVASEAGDPAA